MTASFSCRQGACYAIDSLPQPLCTAAYFEASSISDSVIFTATPTLALPDSVRTMSPRHLSRIFPTGLCNSTSNPIRSPGVHAPAVQKNIPDALTSRVTPVVPFRKTGSAIWIRWCLLFSGSTAPPLTANARKITEIRATAYARIQTRAWAELPDFKRRKEPSTAKSPLPCEWEIPPTYMNCVTPSPPGGRSGWGWGARYDGRFVSPCLCAYAKSSSRLATSSLSYIDVR